METNDQAPSDGSGTTSDRRQEDNPGARVTSNVAIGKKELARQVNGDALWSARRSCLPISSSGDPVVSQSAIGEIRGGECRA